MISSLGTSVSPFREVTLLSEATRALVKAMEGRNVRRLVCITGLGAGDSRGHGGFLFDKLFFPLLLRKVYDDKNRQEDVVRASKLDWVLVRPVVLNDKPATGTVRALTDLSNVHGGAVSRGDVAKFVVQQLTDDSLASPRAADHLVKTFFRIEAIAVIRPSGAAPRGPARVRRRVRRLPTISAC